MKLTIDAGMDMGMNSGTGGARRLCGVWLALCLMLATAAGALAQGVTTTTVQGTVYLADGQPGAGTLVVSWPSFATAAGQAIAADSTTVTIPVDGFVSVNLAPNQGATPAGQYYTAVFYMSDGSVNTQYWLVPAAAQASLAAVQAQVMPAAQAVQAVSKAYVDQSISELSQSVLTASGGTLSGPLNLNSDPTQPLQAADKHYVDTQVATAVPLAGGAMTGALIAPAVNGVEAPAAASSQTTLQEAISAAGSTGAMEIPPTYAGTDTFTNPNGVRVADLRPTGAQQVERSVKEFGAVCDGVTDDTNTLQAALNYANAHGVSLTIPEGTCKTRTLNWHGESLGGMGKQVSALMGFPGQDVLATTPDAMNLLSYTRLHDLTIYVDESVDVSCSPAEGRAAAGSCQISRPMEPNSIFSPGGNGLTGATGTGAGWAVGNCAIAMPASTGAGGNGLKVAEIENLEIVATGIDPMESQYSGAHSTHTCGMYLAQWPQWSEFRNIDIRGLNTGVALPALPGTTPAGLTADSNRWQNVTIQATHGFTAAAGSNNVLDDVVAMSGNSAATGEPPTGLVLDFGGNQQGWTVRNAVVMPSWVAVAPTLAVTASGGAVTAVTAGPEQGLGWDPYGATIPLKFSGSCTAQATAAVNSNGSIGAVTVSEGGVGCSSTTTASLNAAGTWDTAAPVNLVSGQETTFLAGNLLKGNGGYTVWNATGSSSYGTGLDGGGGELPGGGTYAALVGSAPVGSVYQVDQFPGADIGAKMQACVNAVSATFGGTCDARNFSGTLSMASNLTIATANTALLLPCATITTSSQIVVTAGTRNVSLHGCALRGGSANSGTAGGTVLAYSGAAAMVQVGDKTYATDTSGFRMDNLVINSTPSATATAEGFAAYRTQELDLESLYFLGNANQTGMTLDGTGNYTGGTFLDNEFDGFLTAVDAIGHQVANSATTDWMNASTFVRLHIDCPTSSGNPIAGTYGINLQQGDGNTFTGGDVESCGTALHLGSNAQNNTIVGLRNENSTNQVVADAGSSYNNWMTGGTMFTGKLTDNGTRNSFLDSFHRTFNGMTGDWYGSQQDATVTNHYRLGIGAGNERGLQDEYQTDYGYRWEVGFGDGTSGEQFYNFTDLLNNVQRIGIGQYLSATPNVVTNVILNNGGCYSSPAAATVAISGGGGSGASATANMTATSSLSCPGGYTVGSVTVTSGGSGYTSQPALSFAGSNQTAAPNAIAEITTAGSTNDQTVINSAGTGALVLNGSNNSGTGGVVFGSGGATEATVATISNAGNAQFNGTMQIGGTTQTAGTMTVRNNADAEVDYYLWPGLTTSQKGSFTYKDWNGNSEWYMLKDASNNWALNSAVGGLDSFKAYQSSNSGDTYIDASNTTGHIRLNYESGAGTETDIYSGPSASLDASFQGPTAIKFPGLAAGSGHDCLQVDTSGYLTNTGSPCGTGSGGANGIINSANNGQIAYYTASGTTIGGVSAVPLTAGGTGATTAAAAVANLLPGVASNGSNGIAVAGIVAASSLAVQNNASMGPRYDVTQFGATGNGSATTGSISAGSSALAVASASGWSAGSSIILPGAGAGGTNLATAVTAVSGNTLTLAAVASTTVSNATIDDTIAVQAAFNACYQNGGGTVEFPGARTYEISSTIYAYDACRIDGQIGTEASVGGDGQAVELRWNGPAANSNVTTSTSISVQANSPALYTASSPKYAYANQVIVTAPNSYAVNDWVILTGCSGTGADQFNWLAGEVAASSSSSFTLVTNMLLSSGTVSAACTATQTTVFLAFDAGQGITAAITNIALEAPNNSSFGIGIYFGDRMDAGSYSHRVQIEQEYYFGWYFPEGGEEYEISNGSRSDSSNFAQVYWRLGGSDKLSIENTQLGPNVATTTGVEAGKAIFADNESCQGAQMFLNLNNMTMEMEAQPANPNYGMITLFQCPTSTVIPQFHVNINGSSIFGGANESGVTTLMVTPPSDTAATIKLENSMFIGVSGTTSSIFSGIPSLTNAPLGNGGEFSDFTYAPAMTSWGLPTDGHLQPIQPFGDLFINTLYQWGQFASPLLETPVSLSSIPSGTTLLQGQIVAPTTYFNCGTASFCNRYALDVVGRAGTVGTLNGGSTTCTVASGTNQLAASSMTGVQMGQYLQCGTNAPTRVTGYNSATNILYVSNSQPAQTGAALSYSNPIFGSEVQLIAKGGAAPSSSSMTWSQGDFVENSSASANGTAGWVNVSAGSPGSWGAIPLGNASGQLAPSQVVSGTQSAQPACFNGPNGALTNSGCAAAGSPSTVAALTGFAANTGNTANNQVASLTIPAGTLDATGKLVLNLRTSACSGSGTPFTACTVANSGTCTVNAYLATSSTGTNWHFLSQQVAAGKNLSSELTVRAQNSTGSQVLDLQGINGSTVFDQLAAIGNPTSITMSSAVYVNVFVQNSVSGDACYLDQADAVVWP